MTIDVQALALLCLLLLYVIGVVAIAVIVTIDCFHRGDVKILWERRGEFAYMTFFWPFWLAVDVYQDLTKK